MKNRYLTWATKFFESWKNLEGVKTTELLSEDVEYYETALGEPCRMFEEVIELWRVVPSNQANIAYTFNIVAYNEDRCVINWKMSRTLNGEIEQKIDGIIVFSLDSENKCSYFKQWRYTE